MLKRTANGNVRRHGGSIQGLMRTIIVGEDLRAPFHFESRPLARRNQAWAPRAQRPAFLQGNNLKVRPNDRPGERVNRNSGAWSKSGSTSPTRQLREFKASWWTTEGRSTKTVTRAPYYFWRGASFTWTKSIRNGALALIAWGRSGAMRMKEPGLTWTVSLPRSMSASPSST